MQHRTSFARVLPLLALAASIAFVGCTSSSDIDACEDEICFESDPPTPNPRSSLEVDPDAPRDVDILIVADNSRSMFAERQRLREMLPELMHILEAGDMHVGTESEGDPAGLFPRVNSVRIGAITSDLGAGVVSEGLGQGCVESDEARLIDETRMADECAEIISGDYTELTTLGSASAMTEEIMCRVIETGDGCGFEQPLEAALRAVSAEDSGLVFFDGTTGNSCARGDLACNALNAGFLRDDSLLVVINLADEDDCSVMTGRENLYDPMSSEFDQDLNVRCAVHTDALQPTSRYIDGLLATRARPADLVFVNIVGLPQDLNGAAPDTILADERMTVSLRATGSGRGQRVNGACTSDDSSGDPANEAAPGRRFVEVAQGLEAAGAHAGTLSICGESYIAHLALKVASALGAPIE